MNLTEKEILEIAAQHCEFTPEGTYHLNKYERWAIVAVVRECLELAELCAAASRPSQESLIPVASVYRGGVQAFGKATLFKEWLPGNERLTDGEHILFAAPKPETPEAKP